MQEETDGDGRERTTRFYVYWGTAMFATLIFVLFAYVMMASPAGGSVPKLWMLSIAGALLLVPLCIGTWKFTTTDAPIKGWPFETLLAVFLFLEFVRCIIGIIYVILHDPWIP
jgi:hypothetical protein